MATFLKNDVISAMKSQVVQILYIGLFLILTNEMPKSSWLRHKASYDVV